MDTIPQNAIDSAIAQLSGAPILADQYHDLHRRSRDEPELRLIVAVLEEAIRCAVGRGGLPVDLASRSGMQRRADEARAWLASPATSAFSFLWVAESLGFDCRKVGSATALC